MRKTKILSIGLVFILGLTLLPKLTPAPVYAKEAGDGNPYVTRCAALKPIYGATDTNTEPGIKIRAPQASDNSVSATFSLFDEANVAYHSYIACIFDNTVNALIGAPIKDKSILSSTASDTEGIFSANAPNFPEWLKPETSCLKGPEFQTLLELTSPLSLTPPTLEAYTGYEDYLKTLAANFDTNYAFSIDAQTIGQRNSDTNRVSGRLVDELQDAISALDTSFMVLKELRQAYALHVQFQCLLGNLEKYRRMLEQIRSLTVLLPELFISASTVCPNK
jgi:hypothetical protein